MWTDKCYLQCCWSLKITLICSRNDSHDNQCLVSFYILDGELCTLTNKESMLEKETNVFIIRLCICLRKLNKWLLSLEMHYFRLGKQNLNTISLRSIDQDDIFCKRIHFFFTETVQTFLLWRHTKIQEVETLMSNEKWKKSWSA